MGEPVTITINESGDITSVDWQAWLLQELTMPVTRDDVAETYSNLIQTKSAKHWDFPKINKAIMERWSKAGLIYIKEKAWRLAKA